MATIRDTLRIPYGLSIDGARVRPCSAERSMDYTCPECHGKLIFRKGPLKVAHFAHYVDPEQCRFISEGWLHIAAILDGSRNAKIRTGQPGHLDASQGVLLLEVPTGRVTREMGDVHPQGNPHYWLDPLNGRIVASYLIIPAVCASMLVERFSHRLVLAWALALLASIAGLAFSALKDMPTGPSLVATFGVILLFCAALPAFHARRRARRAVPERS